VEGDKVESTKQFNRLYVSSEVRFYTIQDLMKMLRWGEDTVQKLFNDPKFQSSDFGKTKVVEAHALIDFFSKKHVKNDDEYGVNYFLEWDCDKRAQRWTAYRMYKGNTATTVSRSGDDAWHEDEQIPVEYRSTYEDYHYSGFDRGHICPSADRLQNRSMNRQTFCYSNMHPQYNALNAFVWADMETKVRSWNRDSFRDTLYVVKGGTTDGKDYVFDFLTQGDYGVLIPKYFFMAILCL
jgi:endonuclease G